MLALIKSAPLNYRAGEGWDYSNLGYVLLGILVHKVSGKFYGEFLAERVFKPLGMTQARVIKVLRQFSAGTADFKLFTAGARAGIFPRRAEQIGESLNALSLPVAVISSGLDLTGRSEEGDLRVYRYTLTDLGKTLFCTIKLTKEDKIADLQLREE